MAESEKTPSTASEHKTEVWKSYFAGCFFWIVPCLLPLWFCWPKIVSWWSTPNNDEIAKVTYSDVGCFGDLFGSFNALVSMLAFAGFLYALHLQRKDLQLQRAEMKQSRKEMELQTWQFQKDYFSNSFYRRLELIQKLEKAVEYSREDEKGNSETIYGERALEEITLTMTNIVSSVFPEIDQDKYTPNLNKVAFEAINFARSLTYLDTWMQSYTALIEDIDADLKNDRKERIRFLNILVKATRVLNIVLLYAFHDTHLNCPIFDKLREEGIISDDRLHRGTLNKQTRILLYNMWNELTSTEIMKLSTEERNDLGVHIILRYINTWRESHGWEKLQLYKIKTKGINLGDEIGINVHDLMEQVKSKGPNILK